MPVYDIKVDIPERPKGDPIDVPPFGSIENGKTLHDAEMSREDADRYRNSYGIEIKETSARKTDADRAAEQAAEASDTQEAIEIEAEGGEE